MRFVIVCLIGGKALEFHEELTKDLCTKFNVRRQRLPAHFTIKAPFETENISEIEALTENFCLNNISTNIQITDFGHFRGDVVYMDVIPSRDAVKTYNNYVDLLQTLTWLEWKRNEGKEKKLHCTLISKIPDGIFKDIWNYVSKTNCSFDLSFDNISILYWKKDKWDIYKQIKFKNER